MSVLIGQAARAQAPNNVACSGHKIKHRTTKHTKLPEEMHLVCSFMNHRSFAAPPQADLDEIEYNEMRDKVPKPGTSDGTSIPFPETTSYCSQRKRKLSDTDMFKNISTFSDVPTDEPLFPVKLFTVLEDSERKGFHDVVSWGCDGMAFRVHKKREFEKRILPQYFKMTKYKSFTRQLHNYNFSWIKQGPNKGGYFNIGFTRGSPGLSQQLLRHSKTKPVPPSNMPSSSCAPASNRRPAQFPALATADLSVPTSDVILSSDSSPTTHPSDPEFHSKADNGEAPVFHHDRYNLGFIPHMQQQADSTGAMMTPLPAIASESGYVEEAKMGFEDGTFNALLSGSLEPRTIEEMMILPRMADNEMSLAKKTS